MKNLIKMLRDLLFTRTELFEWRGMSRWNKIAKVYALVSMVLVMMLANDETDIFVLVGLAVNFLLAVVAADLTSDGE